MEDFFLNLGLSYTWSKIVPYLLTIVFGAFLAKLVYRRFISDKKLAVVLSISFLIIPFIAYFAIEPIYQGDFARGGKEVNIKNKNTVLLQNGLLVLAIPGCPFCMESITGLKNMKRLHADLKIEFMVLGTKEKELLLPYRIEADGKIKVKSLIQPESFTHQTGHNFPTFVLVKKGKAIASWSNNEFGVRAKDFIVQ